MSGRQSVEIERVRAAPARFRTGDLHVMREQRLHSRIVEAARDDLHTRESQVVTSNEAACQS
jgi:hypothetical protein